MPILWTIGLLLCALAAVAGAAAGGDRPAAAVPDESLMIGLGWEAEPLEIVDSETRASRRPAGDLAGRNPAIRVGEKLTFSVRYGLIRAGEATMEIAGIEDAYGHPCYHTVTTARSSSFFDTVYKVRDRVESWMDVDHLYSRRFRKQLREGSYRANQEIEMDQRLRMARYQDGRVFEFMAGAHDILSAFYLVRTLDLEPGKEYWLEMHADRKNYPLKVNVHGRERVDTPAGEFDTIIVEPMLRTPGLFKQEGSLTIWLTDDERRMPVLMKSKISVGSISVILTEYVRPG